MKFDFVIGNPPYQEEVENNGRQKPIYNLFMDEAYKIGDCVEMITPGRFLSKSGQTPKAWNDKMLNDEHVKVLLYESDGSKIFPNTEIKGGVAITIRDQRKILGPIGIFTEYPEQKNILDKVIKISPLSISEICVGAVPYQFTNKVREEHPECVDLAGESFDLRTNALDKMGGIIFFEDKPKTGNYVQIYGIYEKNRKGMWIKSDYITCPKNFKSYKVLLSKASGTGKLGEPLSKTIIVGPNVGHTQSLLSIGNFETLEEAVNLEKYLKTKFVRILLGISKTTQDLTPDKWMFVPMQDFTYNSDIKWIESVHQIDLQLYNKYKLSNHEQNFVEKHAVEVK